MWRQRVSFLTIRMVPNSDKYLCVMSNTLGTQKGTTELKVKPAETQPQNSNRGTFGLNDESTTGISIIAVVCCVVETMNLQQLGSSSLQWCAVWFERGIYNWDHHHCIGVLCGGDDESTTGIIIIAVVCCVEETMNLQQLGSSSLQWCAVWFERWIYTNWDNHHWFLSIIRI